MEDIQKIIEQMLVIPWPILLGIVAIASIIIKGLTGTFKLYGMDKYYVTVAVFTALFVAYLLRDNLIVRIVVTWAIGLGTLMGGYNIFHKPKGVKDKVTGGNTEHSPEDE